MACSICRPGRLCSYHQKLEDGLIERADEYLSARELEATLYGRAHGDGRRLDHYIIDEPVEWKEEHDGRDHHPRPRPGSHDRGS